MQQITSTQNSLIKYLYSLSEKSKLRREHQEFLFEGKRELSLAIAAGYHIKQLFFCPAILPAAEVERSFAGYPLTEISLPVYEKLSYRSSTEGILALARGKIFPSQLCLLTKKIHSYSSLRRLKNLAI